MIYEKMYIEGILVRNVYAGSTKESISLFKNINPYLSELDNYSLGTATHSSIIGVTSIGDTYGYKGEEISLYINGVNRKPSIDLSDFFDEIIFHPMYAIKVNTISVEKFYKFFIKALPKGIKIPPYCEHMFSSIMVDETESKIHPNGRIDVYLKMISKNYLSSLCEYFNLPYPMPIEAVPDLKKDIIGISFDINKKPIKIKYYKMSKFDA